MSQLLEAHWPLSWMEPEPIDETDLSIIKLLLENGADKSIIDAHGKTAYDYAVELNESDVIELLK